MKRAPMRLSICSASASRWVTRIGVANSERPQRLRCSISRWPAGSWSRNHASSKPTTLWRGGGGGGGRTGGGGIKGGGGWGVRPSSWGWAFWGAGGGGGGGGG